VQLALLFWLLRFTAQPRARPRSEVVLVRCCSVLFCFKICFRPPAKARFFGSIPALDWFSRRQDSRARSILSYSCSDFFALRLQFSRASGFRPAAGFNLPHQIQASFVVSIFRFGSAPGCAQGPLPPIFPRGIFSAALYSARQVSPVSFVQC
jgi:hypothetical protein